MNNFDKIYIMYLIKKHDIPPGTHIDWIAQHRTFSGYWTAVRVGNKFVTVYFYVTTTLKLNPAPLNETLTFKIHDEWRILPLLVAQSPPVVDRASAMLRSTDDYMVTLLDSVSLFHRGEYHVDTSLRLPSEDLGQPCLAHCDSTFHLSV